jgi:nucleoside-diphosphate-sugar epimerase
VNVSSFAVYSNWSIPRGGLLDEACEVERDPFLRYEPYCYTKTKQDQVVQQVCQEQAIPLVTIRPDAVLLEISNASRRPRRKHTETGRRGHTT